MDMKRFGKRYFTKMNIAIKLAVLMAVGVF